MQEALSKNGILADVKRMLDDSELLKSAPVFGPKAKKTRGKAKEDILYEGVSKRRSKRCVVRVEPLPNPSGIHPTEFKVVIKPKEMETVSKGGIIIPMGEAEKLHNAATEGTIIAVSPLAFSYEKWPDGYGPPKVGDRIVYSKYAGMKLKGKDAVEYIIANDKDICAVLE